MDYSAIGFAGLILLVLGWIPQTWQTIKAGSSSLEIHFAFLYFLGSLILAVYSYLVNDMVFVILNIAATLMALINLYFSPSFFGKKKAYKKAK